MDLKVSYNWLKEFVDTKLAPESLAKELSLHAFNVERIHKEGDSLDKVVVGKIVKSEKHPNADKLTVNQVEIGLNKTAQIVCGAPNVYVGMFCAVALPGAKVRWHGEGDLIELKEVKLRGVDSYGMICASAEIGLQEMYPDQSGVMDFKAYEGLKPGQPLKDALTLGDTLFDMEITSNRPDALGIVGLAREAAAVSNGKFKYQPATIKRDKSAKVLPLKIDLSDKKICTKYTAFVFDGVTVQASPLWMQKRLQQAGIRPINNIVDITNYVMLEQGKPMHAFDYDKLDGAQITVRKGRKGEKIKALDGKTYELNESHYIMADAKGPVEIAGVMGGEDSAIRPQTKRIVLLSACFDALLVRKLARSLNLQSDAQSRFEKKLHPESCLPSLYRGAELVLQLAGGHLASDLHDISASKFKARKITLDPQVVSKQVGVTIKPAQIKKTLEALGFGVTGSAKFSVTVPWWRDYDVETPSDLTEEVARLYGYHNLPSVLPSGIIPEAQTDKNLQWESKIKNALAAVGLTELYTYSFVSEKMLQSWGIKPDTGLKLHNPLNEDMVYMRPTLIPSMLQIIGENEGLTTEQSLFELSNIYLSRGLQQLPEEKSQLVLAFAGKDAKVMIAQAKGVMENLFIKLGLDISRLAWRSNDDSNQATNWVASKSGSFMYQKAENFKVSNVALGRLGQINSKITAQFKIKTPVVAIEIDAPRLISLATDLKSYKPLAKFPSVNLDLAIIIKKSTTWEQIAVLVRQNGENLIENVEVFDVYEGQGIPSDSKSLAFHIVYRREDRTLSLDEAKVVHDKIVKALSTKFQAQIRQT